ncbi:oligosaccharide repeat unit polymerase [Pseudomonadales bacterium]|nr:oligosaccharide repeat unit polymerase [Pseudomonadales bacterium]
MSIALVCFLLSLYLALIVISCLKTRDILNPIVLFLAPYSVAILLHFMSFSDFYIENSPISVAVVYCMPMFMSAGILLAILVNSNKLSAVRSSNWAKLHNYDINFKVVFLLFVMVFLLESTIFGVPFFSASPTYAYMNYGLPVIHHLITLVYFVVIFMVALRLSNRIGSLKVIVVIILALVIFVLIFARMQALNVILTGLISYYYFYGLRPRKVMFYGLIIFVSCATAFTFLGNLRTGGISDHFVILGQINSEAIHPFAQLYIYLTISIQNFINLVSNIDSFKFGAYSLYSIVPLVNAGDVLQVNFSDYRASPGLTTFSLGSSFYVDFGVLSYLALALAGYLVGHFYVLFRSGSVFATLCYLGIFSRLLIYGFFYDGLFVTNSIILLGLAYFFSYRLVVNKVIL